MYIFNYYSCSKLYINRHLKGFTHSRNSRKFIHATHCRLHFASNSTFNKTITSANNFLGTQITSGEISLYLKDLDNTGVKNIYNLDLVRICKRRGKQKSGSTHFTFI